MTTPGIISLLKIDGYLNILKYFSLINIGFSSSCHSSEILDEGKKWVNFTAVKTEVMVLELRVHQEFIDYMGQILLVL